MYNQLYRVNFYFIKIIFIVIFINKKNKIIYFLKAKMKNCVPSLQFNCYPLKNMSNFKTH